MPLLDLKLKLKGRLPVNFGGWVIRRGGVKVFELLDYVHLDLVALIHAPPHAHKSA